MVNTFLKISGAAIPENTAELCLVPGGPGQTIPRIEARLFDGATTFLTAAVIDGLWLSHGLTDVSEPVLAWRTQALPGQARASVPPGSAAEIIGTYCQQAGNEFIGLQVSPDNGSRQLPLRIMVPVRFIDLDSPSCPLFFTRLLLPIGQHRDRVLPDYPCPAPWIAALRSMPQVQSEGRGNGSDPTAVTYDLDLRGLDAPVTVSYKSDDLVIIGDHDDPQSDPFQILAWPDLPDPSWKFFSVIAGQTFSADWQKARWGLFTSDGAGHIRPCLTRLRAGVSAADAGRAAPLSDMPGTRLQAVTADRPRFVELRFGEFHAGATLRLLGEPGHAARENMYELGLDMGTSNTCLSVQHLTGAHQQQAVRIDSFNFNMAHESPFASDGSGQAGSTGLVRVRVGDPSRLRTTEPWLPGIEGPKTKFTGDGPQALSQLPSLVVAMHGHFPNWPNTTDEAIRNALPLQDVLVPPLEFVESFASDEWIRRSVTSMKWARPGDPRPQAFLQKYLASIFLFASAKLSNAGSLSIKLSYPLTFTQNDTQRLTNAATAAAAEVLAYTGVAVTPIVYTDESRCILGNFATDYVGDEPALLALCDIGGGSVDIAVATHKRGEPTTLVFLTADSLRFGANLLFNAMTKEIGHIVFPPPADTRDDARAAYVREKMRREVRRSGFDAILTRAGAPGGSARSRFRLYFNLVAEYLARSIAAVIRNPYRFYAATERLYSPGKKKVAIDGPGAFTPGLFNVAPRSIGVVVTGNGWRGLEVLSPGFPLSSQNPQVTTLEQTIGNRVQALVRDPGADDEFKEHFANFGRPRVSVAVGLNREGSTRVVKEALADSILKYKDGIANGTAIDTGLACPNGISEESFDFSRLLTTGKGETTRPWFSFVGSRVGSPMLQFRNSDFDAVPEPGYSPFASDIGVPRGQASPAMPPEIQAELNRSGVSGDVGELLRGELAAITGLVNDESRQRSRPVLSALYVHSLSALFDPDWRWGSV